MQKKNHILSYQNIGYSSNAVYAILFAMCFLAGGYRAPKKENVLFDKNVLIWQTVLIVFFFSK